MRGKNYLQLASLYGHWVTADSIRVRVFLDLPDATSAGFPADVADVAQAFSKARALTVFYGMLYVVVEGYTKLKSRDQAIDALLAEQEYVALLRRFRNAVFHYQEDPMDPRLVAFLDASESEVWIKKLWASFEAYFVRELPVREMVMRFQARDRPT